MNVSFLKPRGASAKAVSATALAVAMGVTTSAAVLAPSASADPQADKKLDSEIDSLVKAPIPTDVDGLLKHVGRISQLAAQTSDEVEQTKITIGEYENQLNEANAALEQANAQAGEVLSRLEGSRGDVTNVASAMYRGAAVDPVSAIVGAEGPQAAVERSSYLNSIASQTTNALTQLDSEIQAAADAKSKAARAKASADFRLRTLNEQKATLDARSAQLGELKTQVMNAVDGLGPADRQRWVDRNGPINVDVNEFLGKLQQTVAESPAASNYAGAVAAAMSKLGAPYSWGAAGPDAFDCSGLMLWAYQQTGKTIPRTSGAQIAGGTPVSKSALQPGDIVGFYPGVSHVGMYIGDGKIVHASDYGIPVQVVSVDSMPFAGAARY